ncbi:MAG: sulfite exporter TauE/SafE family protein [Bacteroidetes bacterium]|nr:sulfite exporter TauE/SafE family protein [Bacteroidota bacterium]MBU1422109.1 sulfite exporter TauE/SafE family protein [Bacteroidota bacterium]
MDFLTLFILLLVGCVIGFLAGFFGVGGGVILVPVLVFLFEHQSVNNSVLTQLAMGTSLFIVIFASISSATKHTQQQNVYWRAVMIMGIASVITAGLGSVIAASLPGNVLRIFFAVVVFAVGLRLFFEKIKQDQIGKFKPDTWKLILIGSVVGVLSSLTGVGGGVFSIPLMYYLANFPIKRAIGTSSATIIITAGVAVTGYILNGYGNPGLPAHTFGFVDYFQAIPLIIGTVAIGPLGAVTAHKIRSLILRRLFAVFLTANALYMFFK